MYKYHKELESRKEYYLYLKNMFEDDKVRKFVVTNAYYDEDVLSLLGILKNRLYVINDLVQGTIQSLIEKSCLNNFSWDDYDVISSFFSHKYELFGDVYSIYNKINISMERLDCILLDYRQFCRELIYIYPNLTSYLNETIKLINELHNKLEKKYIIKLPDTQDGIKYLWPDSWYITPHDFIYNTGCGHQQGNLSNEISDIKRVFCNDKTLKRYEGIRNKIIEIEKNGYVTNGQFRDYANLVYELINIQTPEVIKSHDTFYNYVYMDDNLKKYIDGSKIDIDFERSYQPNIVKLVIGYLDALDSLDCSFIRLNNSRNKKYNLDKIFEFSGNDLRDLLVRFCGFSKVESTVDKTITTSSLYAFDDFREYLDRGYTIEIVPGIVYDAKIDDVSVQNFSSPFIERYLECKFSTYNGKGKVLIKK